MAGYDSPEMNGGAAEKAAALNARNALAARLHGRCVVPPKRKKAVFIGGRVVRAVFGKFDKYGRPLITLYADGDDLNQWMISRGHGYPYSGGTKKKYGAA
jgi:endonuclease YncB( thermonuclease family)